jgi:hypothetical protein
MNKLNCPICNSENFVLNLRCFNCGGLIRENFRTINLGEVLKDLVFNLNFGIKRILYSERKNYVSLLLVLLSIKLTLFTFYSSSILDQSLEISINNLLLIVISFWIAVVLFISLVFKIIIGKIIGQKFSYKNFISIIAYSFLYYSIFGFFLFLLEIMLFGSYFFSNNPSIFQINFYKALAVISLELILILYSIYLLINFLIFILQSKVLSFLFTAAFLFLIYFGNKTLLKIIGI